MKTKEKTMLIILSPAKTLDFETPAPTKKFTQPELLEHSKKLISVLKKLNKDDVGKLMDLSDKLAILNYERFQTFKTPFTTHNAKAALFAFKGDVYEGLQADDFKESDCAFAQKHLCMLSGLYGVLRALDLIQPYRLEMGTLLNTAAGKTLYDFWGDKITTQLNLYAKAARTDIVLNLASQEYFKAVKPKLLKADIITPVFKDYQQGSYKTVGLFAKRARGMMSRFIIKNRLFDVNDIKAFVDEGYKYNDKLSNHSNWVFTRKQN
jgi:hypothetical protein